MKYELVRVVKYTYLKKDYNTGQLNEEYEMGYSPDAIDQELNKIGGIFKFRAIENGTYALEKIPFKELSEMGFELKAVCTTPINDASVNLKGITEYLFQRQIG